jgi:hypothetical protein
MNPYLEQSDTWEDFHHDFITRTREILSGQVGPNYLVKIEVPVRLTLPAVDVERHSSLEVRDRRNRRSSSYSAPRTRRQERTAMNT